MIRTSHDVWLDLWRIGAPDMAIARLCDTHATRVRKWRVKHNLSAHFVPHGRFGGFWEDNHKAEIRKISEFADHDG